MHTLKYPVIGSSLIVGIFKRLMNNSMNAFNAEVYYAALINTLEANVDDLVAVGTC